MVTITAVNEDLESNSELINSDAFGGGWILKVKMSGDIPADLMDAGAYTEMID